MKSKQRNLSSLLKCPKTMPRKNFLRWSKKKPAATWHASSARSKQAREEGEKRARKLIADAIQRVASEHVAEVTRAVVVLPSEEMKGRIVGRNGRNIKAFEQAAGVDVIVDDTPNFVTVSCFDSVRREIGRRALAKLILDGRIHPAHIEKVVEDETKAVERIINEAGEQAAYDANVSGIDPEVLRMMVNSNSARRMGKTNSPMPLKFQN